MNANRRGPWSVHEDSHLKSLVGIHGAHSWTVIASALTSRTPKQCRERWHQNLDPRLDHTSIRPEEGQLIDELVREMGKRWAEIARRLPGRSDNAVKNWWNGGLNRRNRLWVRQDLYRVKPASEEQAQPGQLKRPGLQITYQPLFLPHHQQRVQTPQPSPIDSETSMPDSSGEAPSLISDQSSHATLASPPGNTLIQQRQSLGPSRSPSDVWNGVKYHEPYRSPQLALHKAHDERSQQEHSIRPRPSSIPERRLQHLSEAASNQLPSGLQTSYAPSPMTSIGRRYPCAASPATSSEIVHLGIPPCSTSSTAIPWALHSVPRAEQPESPYYSLQNRTQAAKYYRYPSPEATD